jgi:hypothetical protein
MMKKSPALLDYCCDLVVFLTAGVAVVQTKVSPNSSILHFTGMGL